MEGVAGVDDEVMLVGREVEFGVDVAVNALTGLTSNGDDSCIGGFCLVVDADGVNANLGVLLLAHHLRLEPLGRMTLSLELRSGKLHVLTVDVGKHGR